MDAFELHPVRPHDDRLGRGMQRADRHAVRGGVRAEDRVRIVMVARDKTIEVCGGHGGSVHVATSSWSSRAIPATGIGTQSGRLLSS